MKSKILILRCLQILPLCSAWGNLTHRTIALLAQKDFTPEASNYTKDLLGHETIDSAAIWADSYKMLPWGRETASWHFVDALDDPPSACSVDYDRDCSPNRTCIIAALVRMANTFRAQSTTQEERKIALKFLLHLVGDLHCPLHTESIDRGGNDIAVLYRGRKTNLHFAWDVLMPRDVSGGVEGEDEVEVAESWAQRLHDISPREHSKCAFAETSDEAGLRELFLGWAKDTNSLVCRAALRDGVENITNKELSETYLESSVVTIEKQVTVGGMRLAGLINALVAKGASFVLEMPELKL